MLKDTALPHAAPADAQKHTVHGMSFDPARVPIETRIVPPGTKKFGPITEAANATTKDNGPDKKLLSATNSTNCSMLGMRLDSDCELIAKSVVLSVPTAIHRAPSR